MITKQSFEKIINTSEQKMNNEEILKRLKHEDFIYGYMYGRPYINTSHGYEKDKVIKIKTSELQVGKNKDCFIYIWGYPGPDGNIYKFSDYNVTWSFDEGVLQ